VNRVVPQLIGRGEYTRPVLGIEVDEDLNRLITGQLGTKGVAVLGVSPGSAAAAAGLEGVRTQADGSIAPGDIILSVDGEPVQSVAQLLARLDDHAVGDTVRLTVVRGGQKREVSVTLAGGNR
jgi:S1-C subfamily serine protease